MKIARWKGIVVFAAGLVGGVAAGAADMPSRALNLTAVKPLVCERLGQPVVSMRTAEYVFPNTDGTGWYAIICYGVADRTPMGAQNYVIDLSTGRVRMEVFSKVQGIMSYLPKFARGADGRYYIPHEGNDFGLWRFDPADGSLAWCACPEIKERYVGYAIQAAPDLKKIYIGTASGNSLLIEFDPATQAFRNLGVQGPAKPAPVYVYYMAVDDDYVYMGVRKQPWYLVATDRRNGEQKVLLESEHDVEVLRLTGKGCFAKVTVQREPRVFKYYRLEKGAAAEIPKLPLPESYSEMQRVLVDGHMAVPYSQLAAARPEVAFQRARPDRDGKGAVWWRKAGGDWQHVELTGIQTKPWALRAAKALPDGRLLIAPREYEDYVLFDPRNDRFTTLGKSPLSTYMMECVNGKAYLMGYPGGYMVEYDPAKPWTYFTWSPEAPDIQSPKSAPNPRECHRWSVDIMPVHHIWASAAGPDGTVYFGGHAERVAVGGGLGWWDTATRKAGGIRDPYFLQQDAAGMCVTPDGKTVVYSGRAVADVRTGTPRPADSKLFFLDTATKRIVADLAPVPGLTSCGNVMAVGDRLYGFGLLGERVVYYVVDIATRKTVCQEVIVGVTDVRLHPTVGPRNLLYAVLDRRILARMHTDTGEFEFLGDTGGCASMEFAGQDLYYIGPPDATTLCRVRGLVQ